MKTIKYTLVGLCISSLMVACSSPSHEASMGQDKSYYTQLGVGYLQKGRLDLANMNLEKALKEDANSGPANHYYALLQERLGQDQLAAKYFRKALQVDGKNSELLNNYGSFLCRTGNYSQAEAAFMAALRDPLYKTPEYAYTNAGICVGKQGDKPKAESYFRQALQVNDRFSEALYQMAKLAQEKGDNAKAQAFLYRYNDAAPASADGLLLCYRIQNAMNDVEKAQACADELQAKFPDTQAASQIN